jgi:hypothetical protein
MKRLAGTLIGILLLAFAASGGASAKAPVGSCPAKSAQNPFELRPVSDFTFQVFIDLNQKWLRMRLPASVQPERFPTD